MHHISTVIRNYLSPFIPVEFHIFLRSRNNPITEILTYQYEIILTGKHFSIQLSFFQHQIFVVLMCSIYHLVHDFIPKAHLFCNLNSIFISIVHSLLILIVCPFLLFIHEAHKLYFLHFAFYKSAHLSALFFALLIFLFPPISLITFHIIFEVTLLLNFSTSTVISSPHIFMPRFFLILQEGSLHE